jgi:hypothetical protein
MYGSVHRCGDFPLLAHVIFVSFRTILGIFVHHLICQFEGVFVRISLMGSWVSALCLSMWMIFSPQTPDLVSRVSVETLGGDLLSPKYWLNPFSSLGDPWLWRWS